MRTEVEVRGLFTLAGIAVSRVWQLPHGYLGAQEPLTDEQIDLDRPGERGVVNLQEMYTSGVVKAWMADFRWRQARPAWLVQTSFGLVELTQRKRVLVIDWRETCVRATVTTDSVTCDETSVHAWTTEDALRYLTAWRVAAARGDAGAAGGAR